MSFSLPEEENFRITDNYYLVIKQISEEFIKYISNFKIFSIDYIKKISSNNQKFNIHNLPKIYKEMGIDQVKLDHIILISSIIPSIIEQQIINLDYFIQGIDEKIEYYQKIFNEKSSQYSLNFANYKEIKNELNKKYREIDKLKINYMTNISSTEEMVHKFYIKNSFNKKRFNSSQNPDFKDNKNEINKVPQMSLEEQINFNIQKVKKIEEEYKDNIDLVKSLEDKYIIVAKDSKENIRKILCEILNGFKDLILDCMIFLKNCYKLPLSEIDTFMEEIIKLDEFDNFNKVINSSYVPEKKFQAINPQKYTLKLLQKNKINIFTELEEDNKTKRSSTISLISEEGFQEIDYIQEQEVFLTVKKMINNFDLLNLNDFDLSIEEEKLRCKYLTLKILSFSPSGKLYADKIPPITDEEAVEMEKMIHKKINRTILIQKLSQFRTKGIFEFPEREYKILSKIFNSIIKNIDNNIDYDCMINIIILSQTYYMIKKGKKEYLQKEIMDNDIFKTKKFWETYVNYSIVKELTNCQIGDNVKDQDIEERYSNIVFSQLVPITNNMIDFGLDINDVEKIINPLVQKYNIKKELAESVSSIIDDIKNNKNNINENENDKNEIINQKK